MAEKSWQICDLCDKKRNVNWKCVECGDILCDICKQRHMKGRLTRQHRMITKSEKNKEQDIRAQYECETHYAEQINMFCVRCDVPVCRLCMENKHKRHEVTRIAHGAALIRDKLSKVISDIENNYFPQLQSLLSKFYALKFQFESENLKINRTVEARLRLFHAASSNKADKIKKENTGRDGENGMLYVSKIKSLHAELLSKREIIKNCRENLIKLNDHVLVKRGIVMLEDLSARSCICDNITGNTPEVASPTLSSDDIDKELFAAIQDRTGSNYEKSFVSRSTQTEEVLKIIVTDDENCDPELSSIKQQYSEIYQVEWKMAYDAVSQKRKTNEVDTAQLLLELFKVCYRHCMEQSTKQWDGILREITMAGDTDVNQVMESLGSNGFGLHITNLKEARKAAAAHTSIVVAKELLKSQDFITNFGDNILEACSLYITKCIDVCWLIAVHDRPPHVQWDVSSETPIDERQFHRHSKNGSFLDYIIWPALLVYPDGPVLCKGVVETLEE